MPKFLLSSPIAAARSRIIPSPDGSVGPQDVEAHVACQRHVSALLEEKGGDRHPQSFKAVARRNKGTRFASYVSFLSSRATTSSPAVRRSRSRS